MLFNMDIAIFYLKRDRERVKANAMSQKHIIMLWKCKFLGHGFLLVGIKISQNH